MRHTMEKSLLTTCEPLDQVVLGITRVSPTKLILLLPQDLSDTETKSIETLHSTFGKILPIYSFTVSESNILSIAKSISSIMNEHANKTSEMWINISTEKQDFTYGMMFGAYAHCKNVSKLFYISKETNAMEFLPTLSYHLSPTKKVILNNISMGIQKVAVIAKNACITRGMAYNHINELKSMGYLNNDEQLSITNAGKLAIIDLD